jgi:hypothetical protein
MTRSTSPFPSSRPDLSGALECRSLSRLGENPAAWPGTDGHSLSEALSLKLLEYGTTQDRRRIPGLLALYHYLMERVPVSGRMEMFTEFSDLVQKHPGLGHLGLQIFFAADADPGIRAAAAWHSENSDKVQQSGDSA